MANATKLTVAELKSAIATYVASNKIAQDFSATYNMAGLLDTIGKIYTIDQVFIDKLAEFDGEFLSFGKTVEEWAIDLILPIPISSVNETDAIASKYPTYRPVKFSYELGDQVFQNTYKYNDLNKGVHDEGQLSELVYAIGRSLANSVLSYRYSAKRQLAGRFADAASASMTDTGATLWAANTSASTIGAKFKNASTGTKWAVLVKAYDSTANKTFDQAVAAGYLVEYKTVTKIAPPTTTETGEAFIKQVKQDIEIANDISEGHSLSGNTLGATSGLTLLIKQGYIPSLEVDTYAGAFNKGDLMVNPAKIIVLPDFGTMTDTDVYAMLIDSRAMRLFPTYEYSTQQENGGKAFMNYFRHFDATAAYSLNAFIKVYKNA